MVRKCHWAGCRRDALPDKGYCLRHRAFTRSAEEQAARAMQMIDAACPDADYPLPNPAPDWMRGRRESVTGDCIAETVAAQAHGRQVGQDWKVMRAILEEAEAERQRIGTVMRVLALLTVLVLTWRLWGAVVGWMWGWVRG